MKAIETLYDGHRFRSRLEARWAVFFNAVGWRYEYEIEGFDLGTCWYLPDFYLPDKQTWVEVKGQYDAVGLAKFNRFCRLTKKDGFIFLGEIHPEMPVVIIRYVPAVDDVVWEYTSFGEDRYDALLKARQARFEHGEKGL